ncbi:hypothetical protein CNY89_10590 [Amaricoccus sp. HAR-UPW-R2A-40]|nr:hypothetical protein CNY89_10590 [Amaricoccus sp. HAR-UPW-R2A-40]
MSPINPAPRPTPVVAALTRIQDAALRVDPAQSVADLVQETRAMRTMWQAALRAILAEFSTEDEARRYLASKDGRMVLQFAGFDGARLDRLSLQPLTDRADAHRDASEPARQARQEAREAATRRYLPVKLPKPGSHGDTVFRAAETLYKAHAKVSAGTVGKMLPHIPANTIGCCLTTWRKHRNYIGWDD